MKRITYILSMVIFVLIYHQSAHGQLKTPPVIEWQKCFGGSGEDVAASIQQTNDGGYIVAGYSTSVNGDVSGNHGKSDYWLVKLTSIGNIEWQKSFGGSNSDVPYTVAQTSDSGYIIAGYSISFDGDVSGHHGTEDHPDYWIVKLTSKGNIQWQRSLGGSKMDVAYSASQTKDGGFIISGSSESSDGDVTVNRGLSDYWIVRLTSTGVVMWQKSFGGNSREYPMSVRQSASGGFIVAGNTYSFDQDLQGRDFNSYEDIWILKLTDQGNIEWNKWYGGVLEEWTHSIEQTSDGGYIIGGSTRSYDTIDAAQYWLVKITNKGIVEWKSVLGGSKHDACNSIKQTTDGGYIAAGYSESNDRYVTGHHGDPEVRDCWIVKTSTLGELEWQMSLGGSSHDLARSIQQTADGGFIVAGYTLSNDGDVTGNHGDYDFWIVKLSPEGTSNVESERTATQTTTITPNPATSSATLTLESVEEGMCVVEIISVTGVTLKEYSARLTLGKQEIALTGLESLPSGMYEVLVKRSGYLIAETKLIIE